MGHFDMIDVLHMEEDDAYEYRLARASVVLRQGIDDARLAEFVDRATTKTAKEYRRGLIQSSIDDMVEEIAGFFTVEDDDLQRVAAKHVNPNSPIGGPEDSKYKDTTKIDPAPDATTEVDDTKPVLDKNPEGLETVDLNKDKAKKSSVTVMAVDEADLDGFEAIVEDSDTPADQWTDEDIAMAKEVLALQGTSMEDDAIRLFLTKIAERIERKANKDRS